MRLLSIIFITICFFQQPGFSSSEKDTVPKNRILAKKFKYDFSSSDSIQIDTFLRAFQIYNPVFFNRATNINLGNLCLPYKSVLLKDIEDYPDFLFSHHVKYIMHNPESMVYYHTLQPFTEVNYYSGGPKSSQTQKLGVIHTQNVNRYLNLGFLVDLNYADGQYSNQRGKANAMSLFSSYQRNRYSFNTNFNLNIIKNQENGGILNDSIYESGDQVANALPVNLSEAATAIKNINFFIQQRFYLTGSYKEDSTRQSSKWNEVISFIHRLEYQRNVRTYSDNLRIDKSYKIGNNTVTVSDDDFYGKFGNTIYNDSTFTRDSLYYRRLENTLQLAINTNQWLKVPAELRIGIKNQLDRFNYGMDADSVYSNKLDKAKIPYDRKEQTYFNTALVANLTNRFTKNVNWGASGELFFTGYKAGDWKLKGDFESVILKNFAFRILGEISIGKPGYFLMNYTSNHFEWNKDFSNQKSTKIKAGIYQRKYKLAIEAQTYNYKNYVYFNTRAMPVGVDNVLTVNSLSASKLIDWGVFHSNLRVTFQTSGNEDAFSVPNFSGYNSTYFEVDLFKKVLKVQLGYDLFYNSPYYADGYMPALGVFYSQREVKLKNDPYADVFLNIKLKRARFTIKYEHFNSFAFGSKGYFAPHYPIPPHILNFGLSWTFYD